MMTYETRILNATINASFEKAYDFTCRPENFPKWAAGLSKTLHHTDRGWVADTPDGDALVEFSAPNPHGVLDHWVHIADQAPVYNPLRMMANGDGTEVTFVLYRRPNMTDDAFDRDAEAVTKDLTTLKALLEKQN